MDQQHTHSYQHNSQDGEEHFHAFPLQDQDEIERRLRAETSPSAPNRPSGQAGRPPRQAAMVTPQLDLPEPPAAWMHPGAVQVTAPAVAPISEALGDSIPLPSQFFWYPFKDLYVRPLRVPHLAKINTANETGNLQPLVEVVSSCLVTPGGHQNIAAQLCAQDWIAVLYHLKFVSFNKRGVTITWDCGNEDHVNAHNFWAAMTAEEKAAHVAKVEAMGDAERSALPQWELKEAATLRNKSVVERTTLRTNYLKTAPDPEAFRIDLKGKVPSLKTYARMRPETVLDSIHFMDLPNWESDTELQWLAQQAALIEVLRPDGTPYSLQERIEMIKSEQLEFTTEEFTKLQEFQEIMGTFGVDEFVQVRCMGCGASTLVRSNVDAATFLAKGI